MPNENNSGIMLYAQLTCDNYIHTVFFELLEKAHELSQNLKALKDQYLEENEIKQNIDIDTLLNDVCVKCMKLNFLYYLGME